MNPGTLVKATFNDACIWNESGHGLCVRRIGGLDVSAVIMVVATITSMYNPDPVVEVLVLCPGSVRLGWVFADDLEVI